MKNIIHTSKAPAAIGPYSQGNRAGDTVYLSGQLGIDPATGKLAEGGVGAQARQSLKNIQALLAEVGATEKNVVKTTVFLTSMADFKEVNEAYAAVFNADCRQGTAPQRACGNRSYRRPVALLRTKISFGMHHHPRRSS
mgnify:CR=1 FL=1